MPKVDIKKQDPVRYAEIKLEQDKLREQFKRKMTITIECPFCFHKGGRMFQGSHGAIECKCDNCGEIFIFPPVAFSRTRS